jgi:4-hydroxybenzoate polyprenyltransferase/phosphoserine phosphatase
MSEGDRPLIADVDGARVHESAARGRGPAAVTGEAPLIVDVDGTLVRGDLFWEGLVQLCVRRPGRVPGMMAALLRGRAACKAFVAREVPLRVDAVPLEPATIRVIEEAQAAGRPVILASGADAIHVAALQARIGADAAWASDGSSNLTGEAKLVRIQAAYSQFDYIGNESADLPLWRAARRPFALNPGPLARWRALRARPDLVLLEGGGRSGGRAALGALRPYQWSKNALLLLPALAAHLAWTPSVVLTLLAGFLAFSAAASAVYLVNDLVDLPHDRLHERKRTRPIAAGELSIPATIGLIALLLVIAASLALLLPLPFTVALGTYMLASTAYSLVLKGRAILDVLTLATLYALRLVAGAALVTVPLSRWFLAFSVFFFFSLALVKRVVELRRSPADDGGTRGRGYQAADLPVLAALGAAGAAVSSLVYCLYITSDDIGQLYTRPDVLWLGLPILLYWQARIWLLTGRGRMEEDPVVFALRDRLSHLLLVAFLVTVWLAT